MGRADVLLRFLQLIGKDRPKDLDPFLEGLESDNEQRPLADQIVDRIIAGDPALYETYAQARREVGLRNPYASADDEKEPKEYEEVVGRFIMQWTELESTLRRWLQLKHPVERGLAPSGTPSYMLRHAPVPEALRGELDYVRRLRNQLVHGVERPSPEELRTATSFIERVKPELEQAAQPPPSEARAPVADKSTRTGAK